jgi:hypothetical protein
MGQTVKLIRLIERLAELDDDDTIFACEPWTEDSDAMVAPQDPKVPYGIPPEAAKAGMQYFLEIHIARDFVEDWIKFLGVTPPSTEICRRVIEYAINDA